MFLSSWVVVNQNENSTQNSLHYFMEPCAVYWILFIKLGRRNRSGQSWKCRWRRPCAIVMSSRADDREANKAWCVDRQELFLYLTSQLLQDKHPWTLRPGLQERDVLHSSSILGLPGWIRAGYLSVGDIRPACLFPLVTSKCFLDSGFRRCCKAAHSCMRRVIDCSPVPHKMAWRSVARAIRTVARLGGPGCEIFDVSQLRFD